MIPDRLEVAANEKEVDGVAVLLLERGYLCVYGVEFAVAAAFDGNLCVYACARTVELHCGTMHGCAYLHVVWLCYPVW